MATLDYHALGPMEFHRVVIYLDGIDPPGAARGPLPITVGDLKNDFGNIQYRARLDAGRLGHPGLEIKITLPGTGPNNPIGAATLVFEPGVAAATNTRAEARYNLQELKGSFLGAAGGGGHMYDRDPPAIGSASLIDKRQTLRIEVKAHGAVCHPDTFAMQRLLALPQVPPATRNLIDSVLGASTISLRLYCFFTVTKAQVISQIVEPTQSVVRQRRPPLHQYEPPRNVLTLDMPSYGRFQNRMYCSRSPQHPPTFGPPHYLLPDAQPRTQHRLVAMSHIVAMIRENQGQEAVAAQLGNAPQSMRLTKSRYPILADFTNSAPPVDQQMYVGYVNNFAPTTWDMTTPVAGTRLAVSWGAGIEESSGIVLDIAQTVLQAKNAAFALALFSVPQNVKIDAVASLASATAKNVGLTFVRNRKTALARLASLARFSGTNNHRTTCTLQRFSAYRRNPARALIDDVRMDPATWNRALAENKVYQLQNQPLSHGSNDLLQSVVGAMDGNMQLVETSVHGPHFSTCVALAFQFLALGCPVILISDFSESRAEIASQVWAMRELARQAPEFGQSWSNKNFLSYTSFDVINNAGAIDRMKLDLASKILDDLPRHEWATDEAGIHGQAANAIPHGDVPFAMSMGAAIGAFLSGATANLQRRQRYYQDRQQEIDGTRANDADVGAILTRRNNLEFEILRKANCLVTNCQTAILEKVQTSMPKAVLIFTDTQSVPWYTVASTIASYAEARAVFVCGEAADTAHRLQFSARLQSEAWNSVQYSAWDVFLRAGNVAHSLT